MGGYFFSFFHESGVVLGGGGVAQRAARRRWKLLFQKEVKVVTMILESPKWYKKEKRTE